MSVRRSARLDAIERRLTGPKRLALFGHRNVGKTTLLAMFYRQASTGKVPGVRLAAVDAVTADYLAERIAQIEAGESLAGTLAETELKLRLYHDLARLDLIVKDYQGEHVALGSEEPIQAFFADCDAVLLCLDPEGSSQPADRRRRQQEVENLLERYIERSDNSTTDRPVALIITKFDRLLEPGTEPARAAGEVERVAEQLYGMTFHALAAHAPRSAIFAVSSYGQGGQDGHPPAELHPFGLQGPLTWVAEQLEERDRDQLTWLWELAPDDTHRLARCLDVYERRYPRSYHALDFRTRLNHLRRAKLRKTALRVGTAAAVVALTLAGYDGWGFQAAKAFERDHAAPAVARRWSDLRAWHPSLGLFWPSYSRLAESKEAEWTVKAAGAKVASGSDEPGLAAKLDHLKGESPELLPAILEVERARAMKRHDTRWQALRGEVAAAGDRAEEPLVAVRAFLKEFPETPHRGEADEWIQTLQTTLEKRQEKLDRQAIDDLARAEGLPNVDLRDLIEQARQFLTDHPESPLRGEVDRRLADYVRRLDERDIEKARTYSRQYPTNFATRIEKYQDYLKAHQSGGRFVSEALEAKDQVLRQWDTYSYRRAYDHLVAHPDDVAEVARLLNAYLQAHP
ncbi:MAG TPA: hypothetical protein VGY53_07955, partial [Isosphaeraceae bacterium]|nr:hypothetical protein [Isosphaeraceae bacterium]